LLKPKSKKVAKSEAESVSAKDKGKRQKVGAASIPQKRRKGKADLVITEEQLEEALEEIEKEEAEPKLKRKKAPLDKKSSMVQVTLAMKRMAKEHSDDFLANRREENRKEKEY
jgi:hypothetical protein